MDINGWQLFYFKTFRVTLDELEITVTKLAQSNPTSYKSHPKARLLASVYQSITKQVPANPESSEFRLGKTLKTSNSSNSHWRRVKKGLPDRYRLFFRFGSSPVKLIVYVWLNDEVTLRKAGSKTDVYETFKRMLSKGTVPQSIEDLLSQSQQP
jgi:toxin YhaV